MCKKLFKKIRAAMIENDILQDDIAKQLKCHRNHVSSLLLGKSDWTLSEAYMVLKMLGKPPEAIVNYFPENEALAYAQNKEGGQ